MHPESDANMLDRFDTKIHPRLSRGCKVRGESGSHHRPSRRCRIQGNLKTQGRQSRRVRGPRKLGEPSAGAEGERIRGNPETHNPRQSRKVQDAGKPATTPGGAAGRANAEGKPEASAPEAPKDARFGVTRRSVAGTAGRCRNRGNPGTASVGATGRARAVGKPGA